MKFRSQHDLNFILNAELNQRKFLNKQELRISGEVSGKAYLMLLSYNPAKDRVNKPNKIERNVLVDGQFQIPSVSYSKRYGLNVYIPENSKEDELTEYLILLATKRFDLLDDTDATDF